MRLNQKLRDSGFQAAFVDFQGLPPCEHFVDLLKWFADQIGKSIGRNIPRPRIDDQGEVTAWLDSAFPPDRIPIAIIIDEAGSIENSQLRNSFYGQIRQISSMRANANEGSIASRVRFLFAGTFRPETLVHDKNSPFNVCRRVDTDDITLEQARTLAQLINPEVVAFVEEAHAVLNGQPYLLQTVFQETLRRVDIPVKDAFAEALQNFQNSVAPHLEGIFSKVVGSTSLAQKVAQMVHQGFTSNIPGDPECGYLQVLGLAKRKERKLVFRSSFYEAVAKQSPQLQPLPPTQALPLKQQVFPVERTDLAFMARAELREVCFSAYDGATKSHNSGSYRLALTGFGSAMESLLIDFLSSLAAPKLQAAVASAKTEIDPTKKAKFSNLETENDPMTWRLVNLVNVAQKAATTKGTYVEPSHALRDWRNLVHPKLAIQNFVDESRLQPESVAASALFAMLLRDIKP